MDTQPVIYPAKGNIPPMDSLCTRLLYAAVSYWITFFSYAAKLLFIPEYTLSMLCNATIINSIKERGLSGAIAPFPLWRKYFEIWLISAGP